MNDNPILKFEFTLTEANHILAGLMELPAKIANPLMDKLTKAAKEQLEPASSEAKAELVE